MDLSTYTPSGEWQLLGTPAVREVIYNPCCPEPYSTVTFYIHLRYAFRKACDCLLDGEQYSIYLTLSYLLSLSAWWHLWDSVSQLTIWARRLVTVSRTYWERTFLTETTILLSVCFFITIVSDMTPPTSESGALLGYLSEFVWARLNFRNVLLHIDAHCKYFDSFHYNGAQLPLSTSFKY